MLVSRCLLPKVLMGFQQHEGDGSVRGLLLQQVSENSLKIIRGQCPGREVEILCLK